MKEKESNDKNVISTNALYSESPVFKSWSEDSLSIQSCFVVFLCHSMKISRITATAFFLSFSNSSLNKNHFFQRHTICSADSFVK
jgi:hypothetical protein